MRSACSAAGTVCRNLPFGFVLIDDPVQAMAPGEVEGLARVLATVAKERQVVALTHHERLPESACRLQIPAHVIEVVRRLGSPVACRTIGDPVPRFCRLAMEAACARGETLLSRAFQGCRS